MLRGRVAEFFRRICRLESPVPGSRRSGRGGLPPFLSVWVAPGAVESTLAAAQIAGHIAWVAGKMKKEGSRKAVTIPSLNLAYEADTLQVR